MSAGINDAVGRFAERMLRLVRTCGRGRAPSDLPAEFAEFRAMSARIGADPALVQGPGGNTSVKTAEMLWVKASGFWLADALRENIFVALPRPALLERVRRGKAEDLRDLVQVAAGAPRLRASIETGFHALLPQPIVLHAHPLNSIATSVLDDGADRFRAAVPSSARGVMVPYCRPGTPLAGAIEQCLAAGPTDVLLLQNHGLIVGAETAAAAEALLREMEGKLALPERHLPQPDPARVADHGSEDYEPDFAASGIAYDSELIDILGRAALVPDQVVFMGGAVCVGSAAAGVDAAAAAVETATRIRPVLVILPDIGLFRLRSRSRGADSVIEGLLGVARRLPRAALIRGLSPVDVTELLDWDAEQYRQQLDRTRI